MFSIGFLTLDILLILGLLIGFFFVSMTRGEYVLARIILTFYPATLVYLYLPYFTPIDATMKILTYVILFVVLHLVLGKHFTARRSYAQGKKILDACLLSFATVITLLTIYYHVLPLEALYTFTLPFAYVFTTTLPFGVWLLVPIALLSIANRGHHGS
jgi:hypothetical protein